MIDDVPRMPITIPDRFCKCGCGCFLIAFENGVCPQCQDGDHEKTEPDEPGDLRMDEPKKTEAQPAWYADLNGNGIPDYREPWLYRAAWTLIRFAVGFVPQHTLLARGVEAAEAQRARLEAELRK